jgi:transcriptional regulator with XRE-family HTH domain
MAPRDEIHFGQVLRQLLNERFRNRRKDFARAIHVSESALSQYVRRKATPSLAVLVAIARELDVSLDYLVFGTEPDAPAPDHGSVVAQMEEAIARTQVKTATLRDFVGRLGTALAAEIESTAQRLVIESNTMLGGLTAAEVYELENISRYTRIATADLDVDVLLLPGDVATMHDTDDADRREVAPVPFTPVIINNIRRGRRYNYIIPEGQEWRRKARLLRDAVSESNGMSKSIVDRKLRFVESPRALTPSYVVYDLDYDLLSAQTERLLDRIRDFVDESSGLVALAEPTSRQTQYYTLIDRKFHSRILSDHETMARARHQLIFD